MKLHRLSSLALLTICAPAFAATPASGELTDTGGPLTYAGGPYVVPNPGAIEGDIPLNATDCDVAPSCDDFALKVTIADKFRMNEKNKKEIVQIVMTFTSAAAPLDAAADIDIFLLNAAGEEVGSSHAGMGVTTETINVPLKTLKDGDYTIRIATGVPLGANASVDIHIGRSAKSGDADVETKEGSGLALGAFGLPALFSLFGLALLRRRR